MFELTAGQAELLDRVIKWHRNWENEIYRGSHPQWFTYSGAAGTGKTVVAKQIIEELGLDRSSYIAAAYVGKAVLQLQKSGLNAKTIHSLIYNIVPVMKRNPITKKKFMTWEFQLKEKLDKDYRLLIIDEAGMVNEEMQRELLSFKIPIIFMGDMNQLPPVFGDCSVMLNPDYVLTQIMRQKENDPIVQLSQMVLNDIPLMEGTYGNSHVMRQYDLGPSLLKDYDQIITPTNKVRAAINGYVRKDLKGYYNNEPRLFDKVICRQNNWGISVGGYSLTNGLTGIITDISRASLAKGYYIMDFQPDFFDLGKEFRGLHVDAKYLTADWERQKLMNRTKNEKFEYAYCITVYNSQGSEFDRVLFIDSWFHSAELTKRSRYTAITRAKTQIDIVTL